MQRSLIRPYGMIHPALCGVYEPEIVQGFYGSRVRVHRSQQDRLRLLQLSGIPVQNTQVRQGAGVVRRQRDGALVVLPGQLGPILLMSCEGQIVVCGGHSRALPDGGFPQ